MKRAAALAALALITSGCGGGGRLTIYAASSLTGVFQRLDPKARFNFAGSDDLAFQLDQGAKADVFASASPKYAEQLFAKGLLERPRVFATNRLVLIVPRSNPARITSLDSLMSPRVRLVLAARGVPAGDYARTAVARFCKSIFLSPGARCPQARVVSEEQDVKGVVVKVELGEADAGFVYSTDARAAAGNVRAIPVPRYLQPVIRYPIAVLRAAPHRAEADRFVMTVLGAKGRRALVRAGFGLP